MSKSKLEDFDILSKLGSGSFGTVFKVRRLADNDVYVLKSIRIAELSFKEQSDAINEVRILSQLDSPYIVKYFDSFIDSGSLHIIMEFCNKGDLQTLIKKAKEKDVSRLKESITWNVLLQVVVALYYLHSRKILHRDLKSANVFLSKSEGMSAFHVKVGDLGVAKLLETSTAFAQTIVGTPYYLSPELCSDQPYRDKSDCWALGVLIYECCTLRHPFEARNQCALILKIMQAEVILPSPEVISIPLRSLIEILLQKNPLNRPTIKDILCDTLVREKLKENRINLPEDLIDTPEMSFLSESVVRYTESIDRSGPISTLLSVARPPLPSHSEGTSGIQNDVRHGVSVISQIHKNSESTVTDASNRSGSDNSTVPSSRDGNISSGSSSVSPLPSKSSSKPLSSVGGGSATSNGSRSRGNQRLPLSSMSNNSNNMNNGNNNVPNISRSSSTKSVSQTTVTPLGPSTRVRGDRVRSSRAGGVRTVSEKARQRYQIKSSTVPSSTSLDLAANNYDDSENANLRRYEDNISSDDYSPTIRKDSMLKSVEEDQDMTLSSGKKSSRPSEESYKAMDRDRDRVRDRDRDRDRKFDVTSNMGDDIDRNLAALLQDTFQLINRCHPFSEAKDSRHEADMTMTNTMTTSNAGENKSQSRQSKEEDNTERSGVDANVSILDDYLFHGTSKVLPRLGMPKLMNSSRTDLENMSAATGIDGCRDHINNIDCAMEKSDGIFLTGLDLSFKQDLNNSDSKRTGLNQLNGTIETTDSNVPCLLDVNSHNNSLENEDIDSWEYSDDFEDFENDDDDDDIANNNHNDNLNDRNKNPSSSSINSSSSSSVEHPMELSSLTTLKAGISPWPLPDEAKETTLPRKYSLQSKEIESKAISEGKMDDFDFTTNCSDVGIDNNSNSNISHEYGEIGRDGDGDDDDDGDNDDDWISDSCCISRDEEDKEKRHLISELLDLQASINEIRLRMEETMGSHLFSQLYDLCQSLMTASALNDREMNERLLQAVESLLSRYGHRDLSCSIITTIKILIARESRFQQLYSIIEPQSSSYR